MRIEGLKNVSLTLFVGLLAVMVLAACAQSAPPAKESPKVSQPETKPAAPSAKPAEPAKTEAAKPQAKAEATKPQAKAEATKPQAKAGATVPKAKTTKFRLAFATTTLSFAIPKLAEALGYFKDEGVDYEEIILQGGAATSAAFVSGDVDGVGGGPNELITLMTAGKKGSSVYSLNVGNTMAVAASNSWIQKTGIDLKSAAPERISKLKGAVFGAPSLGGTTEMYIWLTLKEGGLKKGDAEVIRTGGGAQQVAALEANQIDAVVATPPTPVEIEMRGKGRVVVWPRDLPGLMGYPKTAIYVRQQYLEENLETLKKLVRALEKARQMIKDNPTEASKKLLPKFKGMSEETMQRSLTLLLDNVVGGGKMTEDQWQKMGSVMMESGELKEALPTKTEGVYWTNEAF